MVGSSFHGEEQPEQRGSGDPSPHKGQVDKPVVKPGLWGGVEVGPQVRLVQGQNQDVVSLDGDPVPGGQRLV